MTRSITLRIRDDVETQAELTSDYCRDRFDDGEHIAGCLVGVREYRDRLETSLDQRHPQSSEDEEIRQRFEPDY